MKQSGIKVTVAVRLREEVYDPAGAEVRRAAEMRGINGLTGVRINKLIELEFSAGSEPQAVREAVDRLCAELLVNPVVEESRLL